MAGHQFGDTFDCEGTEQQIDQSQQVKGPAWGAGAVTATPEPATIALLWLGGLTILQYRRRQSVYA